MAVLKIILTVVFIIISIALTVIILMQEVSQQDLEQSQERLILTGARTKDVPWKEDW
mgnify:CR=1 FL=1